MNWANAYTFLTMRGVAHNSTVESCVQFSLDTPLSALGQFVDNESQAIVCRIRRSNNATGDNR